MATYGLLIENEGNELVLADAGLTYSFVGQATFVSTTQPGTSTTDSGNGFSTYTINWPGPITVALPVKTNGATLFLTATQAGSTWTITVHKANGSTNALGFDVQEQTEVYVFGAPVRPPDGTWGLFLFDDAGNITADLSRRPLSFVARIATATENDEWTLPAGSYTAAVVGGLGGAVRTSSPGPSGRFIIRLSAVAWRINAATGKLYQEEYLVRYSTDDAPGQTYTRRRPFNGLLVNVAGL